MTASSAARVHWDAVYATRDETAVSWFEADAPPRVALIARHLPDRAAAILDVGSGLTRLLPALRAEGHTDLTALDISAEAIARARLRSPDIADCVAWIVADVADWTPERRFALWHDRAVLHFLTDEPARAGYRRALEAGTAPGSLAILSTFAPDGPTRCSGLPVRRHGRAEFEAFLGPGWRTAESSGATHRTPGGAKQRFWTHVARRV
jgi:SAM-dependent methyltransferase